MAILPKAVVLAKFQNQDKPTEQDFVDFYESVVADVEVAATGTAEARVDSDIKAETPAPGRYISPNTLLEAIQYYGETIEQFLNTDDNTGRKEGPTRNVLTNLGADIDDDGTVNDKGEAGFMKLFLSVVNSETKLGDIFSFTGNTLNRVKKSLIPDTAEASRIVATATTYNLGSVRGSGSNARFRRWGTIYARSLDLNRDALIGGTATTSTLRVTGNAGVTGSLLVNGGITLSGGTLTMSRGTSLSLQPNSIGTNDIAGSAITTAKINDDAVTNAKVATGIAHTKISGLSTTYYTRTQVDAFFDGERGGKKVVSLLRTSGDLPTNRITGPLAPFFNRTTGNVPFSRITGAASATHTHGLTAGDISGSIQGTSSTLSIRSGAVDTLELANDAVNQAKMATGTSNKYSTSGTLSEQMHFGFVNVDAIYFRNLRSPQRQGPLRHSLRYTTTPSTIPSGGVTARNGRALTSNMDIYSTRGVPLRIQPVSGGLCFLQEAATFLSIPCIQFGDNKTASDNRHEGAYFDMTCDTTMVGGSTGSNNLVGVWNFAIIGLGIFAEFGVALIREGASTIVPIAIPRSASTSVPGGTGNNNAKLNPSFFQIDSANTLRFALRDVSSSPSSNRGGRFGGRASSPNGVIVVPLDYYTSINPLSLSNPVPQFVFTFDQN